MSKMSSPASDHGVQSSSHVTRPGVIGRPPWMAGKFHGDSGSEENSSITMEHSSLKEEVRTDCPSTSTWNRPAHMTSSLNRHDQDSALAQQARKAAFMYGGPLQALRANVARANYSAFRDEAQQASVTFKGTDSPSSSHMSAGAPGSPLPFYSRNMKEDRRAENGVESASLQQQQQQHPNTQGGTGIKRPGTAQLTIFYADMVNVYDDVPLDKAQAIMLLAGTGNAWSSSNYTSIIGTGGGMNRPMSRAGSPAPHLSSTPVAGPSSGAVTKLPNRLGQVTTAVELPQARKASLARFLEKRKDRVRRGPYTHPNDEAAKNDDESRRTSRENSPNHPDIASGKPPGMRPLSPTAAGNETVNEANSQARPPPRPSLSEDKSLANMFPRKESEDSNVDTSAKSSPSR